MSLLDAAADVAGAVLTAAFGLVPSLPFALVLLAGVAGALLAPLTVRSVRAGRALAAVQPELRRLRREHAGDPAALRTASAAALRRAGVNPFLPIGLVLLQLPVGMAVFRATRGLADHQAGLPDPHHVGGALAAAIRSGSTSFLGVDLTRSAWAALHGSPGAGLVVGCFALVVLAVALAQRHAHGAPDGDTPPAVRAAAKVGPVLALVSSLVLPLSTAVTLTAMGAVRALTLWMVERRPPTM